MSQSTPVLRDQDINEDYKQSKCGKLFDDFSTQGFDTSDDMWKIETCCIKCNAPYFCHPSKSPHPECKLDKDRIFADMRANLTTGGNCVLCLGKNVVCKPTQHFSEKTLELLERRKRSMSECTNISEKRLKRWEVLNSVLKNVHHKKEVLEDDTEITYSTFSSMNISTVSSALPIVETEWLTITSFDNIQLGLDINRINVESIFLRYSTYIQESLQKTTRKLSTDSNEAKKLYFVQITLHHILLLLSKISYEFEELLEGTYINIKGRFEIILSLAIGDRFVQICIIEAKKEDFNKGRAQCVTGMEVLSERHNVDVVFGIVTDFYRWQFIRSDSEGTKYQTFDFFSNNNFDSDNLKDLFSKLFSFLSTIEQTHSPSSPSSSLPSSLSSSSTES